MKTVFIIALLTSAAFMACALPHIIMARRTLLIACGASKRWRFLNLTLALAGLSVICGLSILGFAPWDRALDLHLACSQAIFGGGFWWSLGSYGLFRYFTRVEPSSGWCVSPTSRRLQLPVALVSGTVVVFAMTCLAGAAKEDPHLLDESGLREILGLAATDFDAYCEGARGWHAQTWINFAALFEWLYCLLLAAGVIASAADLEAHAAADRCRQRLGLEGRIAPAPRREAWATAPRHAAVPQMCCASMQ
eukprot:CAMPEP_0183522592 /NCGR_PEP_ID=MMETSP0371-20130417/18541_1 /TAXON_ID=268820 /ORGANISM="Peridinium aciculiferum, Strain PAER-2" /LENGTH=249 /DNA_ID=CAMNT_0025721383 /DNA_START=137 /DNA_END=886 /DNA_ORIENTATION=+